MSGAIKAYDSRLHKSNQGPRVHPSLEAVQEWWGPFRLTLRWASQPKGDCKVSHHSSQLCVFSALFIFNLDKN